MTTEDVTKLPQWAQRKIVFLENEIARQKRHIAELSVAHPGSNVSLSRMHPNPDFTLPDDSEVIFHMGESRTSYQDTIHVRHLRNRQGWLTIDASGGSLVIAPWASNVARVRISSREENY